MAWRGGIKVGLLLAIMAFCLLEFMLRRRGGILLEYEAAFLSLRWLPMICFAVWCAAFVLQTFSLGDLALIGLLLAAIIVYFVRYAAYPPATGALTLLFGVALGKATIFCLFGGSRRESAPIKETGLCQRGLASTATLLIGLILLLAFSSFWHLEKTNNVYRGPRWMGLWGDPNEYGLLMGAGVALTIGLFATRLKAKGQRLKEIVNGKAESRSGKSLRSLRSFEAEMFAGSRRRGDEAFSEKPQSESGNRNVVEVSLRRPLQVILCIAALMMGTGLVMSYSRGAWIGTAIGLLYLAKAYGKIKWRFRKIFLFSAFCFLLLVFGVWIFWNTSRTAPWYFQRLDFSRGSVQHRVVAWKGGFEIMSDHPLGVGWGEAVDVYAKQYSPSVRNVMAIATNDYLMLGTQSGVPALICFLVYVGLCFRRGGRVSCLSSEAQESKHKGLAPASPAMASETPALLYACRAGALVCLVAFWFDGGLFKLATASVFWILLELGSTDTRLAAKRHKRHEDVEKRKSETAKREVSSPCPSPRSARRGDSCLCLLSFFAARRSAMSNSPRRSVWRGLGKQSAINQSLVTSAAAES